MQASTHHRDINTYIESLPQELKTKLANEQTRRILSGIADSYQLTDSQKVILINETTDVLLALSSREQFAKRIQQEISVDRETATRIANEVDEKVFTDVENVIHQIWKSREAESNNKETSSQGTFASTKEKHPESRPLHARPEGSAPEQSPEPGTREAAQAALSQKEKSPEPSRDTPEAAQAQPRDAAAQHLRGDQSPPAPEPHTQQEPPGQTRQASPEQSTPQKRDLPEPPRRQEEPEQKVPYQQEPPHGKTTDLDGIPIEDESVSMSERIDGFNQFQEESETDERNLTRDDVLAQIENPDKETPRDSVGDENGSHSPQTGTNDPDRQYGGGEDPYREPVD